jgi:predicted anti-sigma-YlaC factor YlaD
MKLVIPAVLALVLLTGASGPGPLKDSMGALFTFREDMAQMRGEIADLRHGRGSAAPAWVNQYAGALCAADSAYLVKRTDPALGVTEEDLDAQFQRMRDNELNCTSVRYLGSVGQTQFVFVLRHGAKDVWYVMTLSEDGETIAKVE